jgi:hypothetical protein
LNLPTNLHSMSVKSAQDPRVDLHMNLEPFG